VNARPSGARPRATAYLHPGQLLACAEPTTVTTILGSCVAVSLTDRHRGVGGLNHFLLPWWTSSASATPRFGNVACERLLEQLCACGASPRALEARVYGGASLLGGTAPTMAPLGGKNVDVALEFLAAHRIPVVESDVGGSRGRRLVINTDDGRAELRAL